MPLKSALCLQFWEGDKALAMENARRIADNEAQPRSDTEFVFCARWDAAPDPAVVAHVRQKFPFTSVYTSNRRGASGHPYGCNELWSAVTTHLAPLRLRANAWTEQTALFTLEADAIPVRQNWIDAMHIEWARVSAKGKHLFGCWMPIGHPEFGHLNGNMVVRADLFFRIPAILGCPPEAAWDMQHAPAFAPHWEKSGWIANYYKDTNVTDEQIRRPVPGFDYPPFVVHGVKDRSVCEYADRALRRTVS